MSKYYTKQELVLRVVWAIVELVLFRFSPRICYGWRNMILRIMGAKIGKGVQVFPSVRITFPWLLEMGDRAVLSWEVKVYNLGKITIGNHTVVSQYSHLCGGTHDYETENFALIPSGLTIGNNVWLGADSFIGPGVRINDGAIVGARAVVVKDVPSLAVVAGNPARVIKNLQKVSAMDWGS